MVYRPQNIGIQLGPLSLATVGQRGAIGTPAETLSDLYLEHWVPANEMVLDVSAAPTPGTRQGTTLWAAHYDYLEYADAVDTFAYAQMIIPEDFDDTSGELSWAILWETDTADAAQTCNWQFASKGIGDGENLNASVGLTQGSNQDAQATPNRRLTIGTTVLSFASNVAKGEVNVLRIGRLGDTGGGNDDLIDTARLIGFGYQWKRTAADNAAWS